MARVTVEDCIDRVPNRFELALAAAQRSRDVAAGAPIQVNRDRDKNPVVSLREIADGLVSLEALRNTMVRGLQRHVEFDEEEPEEEPVDLMAGETEQEVIADTSEQEGVTEVDQPDEALGDQPGPSPDEL